MSAARWSLPLASCAFAALTLLSAGCATAPPQADKMTLMPMGTVTTYHRKSSGSLGEFDGRVVWTTAPATWQDRPAVSFGSTTAGVSLHDPVTFAQLATLDTAGRPISSYEPPLDYRWPLEVGKTWASEHQVRQWASGRVIPMKFEWKVESWGDVTVPAGTFQAFKLVWRNNLGEVETRWVNPERGLGTIKRHIERPASHPLGAGVLDAELLSITLPAR